MSSRALSSAPGFRPLLKLLLQSAAATLGLVLALVFAAPATAFGHGLQKLLAYEAGLPLDLRVVGREHRPGVLIEDVTYASVTGAPPVAAFIVRPAWVNAPYAGIVFGHWFEPSAANSNRTQFLDEAVRLARRGVVSVLPATLWSDPLWFDSRSWRNDFRGTLGQAKDFRRAIDVLQAQGGVDDKRIAFVGHDFSAMHGALIAAVETRVKAWVLIAGTARWADWYLFGAADGVPAGEELTAYLAQLARIDPIAAVAKTRVPVMLQFGEEDFYTPRANFVAFYSATPAKASRIATYPSEHPMDAPIIRLDRDQWLAGQLGLPLRSQPSEATDE